MLLFAPLERDFDHRLEGRRGNQRRASTKRDTASVDSVAVGVGADGIQNP